MLDDPLPTRTYIPGRTARPREIHPPDVVVGLDPGRWQDCWHYVRGWQLFEQGCYWEAHEAWEAVWIAAGRRGEIADFLKVLIKLAAAGVKLREGRPAGAVRHAARARELLTPLCQTDRPQWAGVAWAPLAALTDSLQQPTVAAQLATEATRVPDEQLLAFWSGLGPG